MRKYDERFKLKVVQQYLSGGQGFKTVARQYDLADSTVCQWVARYRQHGLRGLSKKFSHYSASFKRRVLQRMWRDGLSQRQTAVLFDIRNSAQVGTWERQYHEGGLEALAPPTRGGPTKMPRSPLPKPIDSPVPGSRTLEQVLKENEYLRAENAYLKKLEALIQAKKTAAQKKRI